MAQQAEQAEKKHDQCNACNKAFKPDPDTNKIQMLLVENFALHPNCFRCHQCNEVIDHADKYHKAKNGTFQCIGCTKKEFGSGAQLVDQLEESTCTDCGEDLGGNCLTAGGKAYHPRCFKCKTCAKNLANAEEGHCQVDGIIFCKQCRQKQLDNK